MYERSGLSQSAFSYITKPKRETNTFILVHYYEPHAHTCLPHSYLAGNNLRHLLQLCLNQNWKYILYFKLSHVSSNLARRGSLVFTWVLIWPASLSENCNCLDNTGFSFKTHFSFKQREAQRERQNSSLGGQQRELKAGEHNFGTHFAWESRVLCISGLL